MKKETVLDVSVLLDNCYLNSHTILSTDSKIKTAISRFDYSTIGITLCACAYKI